MTEPTEKLCKSCGHHKPLGMFSRSKRGVHGTQTFCKRCRSERYTVNKVNPWKRVGTEAVLDAQMRCWQANPAALLRFAL